MQSVATVVYFAAAVNYRLNLKQQRTKEINGKMSLKARMRYHEKHRDVLRSFQAGKVHLSKL